ncbi:MAG: fimbrillin family protein [Bacteroides sp.]|nr:fimbrillin family protein [Bacteroides sp.]
MKNTLLSYLSCGMVLYALVFYSCVNHISEEEPLPDGEVPIQVSTHASGTTELPQQGFRENDAIGLYGLIYPNTLSDARYLDNVKLTCDASLNFIPEKEIFFPKREDKCELIAYFPYHQEGMETGKSQWEVSVRSDQAPEENFILSDFRMARTDYQTFSNSQVKLTFRHLGCLLKIKIVNASENPNALISEDDIEVQLYGFYRQALYDLDEKEFSGWELPERISPFGEWIQQEKQLNGKQAILIPQPFRQDDQYLTLSIDGKVHICPFPESLKLESGKICELTIRYNPEEREIGDVSCETEEWSEGTSGDSETQELTHPIYLSDLPFDQSGVCRILYQGRQVAEVCKEFIRCEQTEAQGIVVYPVTDGKSDLTQGRVLHLIDVSEPVHGGSLS